MLAIVIASALFTWWVTNVGRGFLESHSSTLFLDAQRQHDGQWMLSQSGAGNVDAPDPPIPVAPENVRIRVQKSTMGRTDMGAWSSWRASNWVTTSISEQRGEIWNYGDDPSSLDEILINALDELMLVTIIPASDTLVIWPNVSPDSVQRNGSVLWWIARQSKTSIPTFAAIVAMCLALGIVASCAVIR